MKKSERVGVSPARPSPPTLLFDPQNWIVRLTPADGMRDWVDRTFLVEASPLFNEDHRHLKEADVEFLWASVEFQRQMRRVVGQCEQVTFRAGGWQKARQEQQMLQWFGRIPDFLITLDALYANQASDLEFCALVEHELYHIAQRLDEYGQPAFTKDGLPKLGLRGHDVEEFVGVVRRYGVGASAGESAQFAAAANAQPEIGRASIAQACGTCIPRSA